MRVGGTGVALVEVEMMDAHGRPVPTANNTVTFAVSDGAHIIGEPQYCVEGPACGHSPSTSDS